MNKSKMDDLVGRGAVESGKYEGTLPSNCRDGEPVIVLKRSDLERLLTNAVGTLLATGVDMPPNLYTGGDLQIGPIVVAATSVLPDELIHVAQDGTQHKLFLDHHLYSPNRRDTVWVRWANVDQSFLEENP